MNEHVKEKILEQLRTMTIAGLSMGEHAQALVDRTEADKVLHPIPLKYPDLVFLPLPMRSSHDIRIFRVTPIVITAPDYSKGFGHGELVTC